MTAAPSVTQPRSTIGTAAVDDITIDPRVQREEGVDERRVERMAAAFDPDALGILVLSQRNDGTLVCLDGAHRCATARRVGWNTYLDARIFRGLSLAEEASLFLLYNDKKDPSAISKFKARVITGDDVAVEINAVIKKHGWTVSTEKSKGGVVSAAEAMERVYRKASGALAEGAHPEILDRTFAVVTEAWGHEPSATAAPVLEAIAQLFGRFGSAVDGEKLIRELQDTQPRRLIGQAKSLKDLQGGTVPAALAKILVGMHNRRRRTNLLPEWVWVR